MPRFTYLGYWTWHILASDANIVNRHIPARAIWNVEIPQLVIDWKPVGARIKKRREALSLTQRELGTKIGMVASTVAQHESGVRATRDEKLALFAKALDVSESWLRYGVVGMSDTDREMIERDAYLKGFRAFRERARRALLKIGFDIEGDTPLARAFKDSP